MFLSIIQRGSHILLLLWWDHNCRGLPSSQNSPVLIGPPLLPVWFFCLYFLPGYWPISIYLKHNWQNTELSHTTLLSASVQMGFMLKSLITSTWVLCMGIDMDLYAFFYMLISSYVSIICWRNFLFSIVCYWFLCQKSGIQGRVGLCQDLQFNSIDSHAHFYVNTKLFLLP